MYRSRAGISHSGTIFAGMMPAATRGARRSGTTLESANWPQTTKVTAASVIAGWSQAIGRNRALASGVRTAMKRQFCKWKDVGAVVPIRTSSRIWSSLKVTAGSKYLVLLRLTIESMMALVMVIPLVVVIPIREGIG